MTQSILKTTTAIALAVSLTSPGAALAGGAETFAPGAFQVAQADNTGKNDKAKGHGAKKAKAEDCADGTEPPCDPAAKSEEAVNEVVTEQPKPVESVETAPVAEEKPSEAAVESTSPATNETEKTEAAETKPAEAAPAATEEAAKPEEAAPTAAAADSKPEEAAPAATAETQHGKQSKKKKGHKDQAASDGAAPQKEAEAATAPAEDAKPVETTKDEAAGAPKIEESQAASKLDAETAPATAEKPVVETADAPKRGHKPAAAAEESAAPVGVTSETVTEETTRTSDEEVPVAKSGDGGKKKDSDDLAKILGAAAGGVVVGVLLNEAFGGGKVVESTGDRVIIERDGEYVVRKDENEILRRPGSTVRNETFSDGSSRTVVDRANGVQVVTIRDADGYVVRRSRIMPDGEEILLFDDTRDTRENRRVRIQEDEYPRYDSTVPHRRYVDYGDADRRALDDVLRTRPIAEFNRSYSLRQVREDERVRDAMPRLDLDVLTFDTGSAAISPRQARNLDPLGWAMQNILIENPDEVFLIEGHTDAVGSRFSNLVLSDRRAEAVALALTEYYDIPPENLITQGYGEEFLKIETDQAERANRRAAVRRITPLLEQSAARR